jgi:D-arabinitol dehydrogenase (NADP+)
MLAQLMRHIGGCQVTLAAPEGLKMDLAKTLDAGDAYIELSRDDPEPQLRGIKENNPFGFDIGW